MGKRIYNHDIIIDDTASRIGGIDANKKLVSLDTATYPSLTELSYVKGVTSSIQTQINGLGVWTPDSNTWTYASADDSTFTLTVNADVTSSISAGMRIRLVQTTTKYFIVTAISYSAPDTTITLYGGTDYDLANAAITLPYYSGAYAPVGFPTDPTKWEVIVTDTSDRQQLTPVAGTWYNLGTTNSQISIPIGIWNFYLRVGCAQGSQLPDIWVTLSTANNTESNRAHSGRSFVNVAGFATFEYSLFTTITAAAKTTYYLNAKTGTASASYIQFMGGSGGITVMRARTAYI